SGLPRRRGITDHSCGRYRSLIYAEFALDTASTPQPRPGGQGTYPELQSTDGGSRAYQGVFAGLRDVPCPITMRKTSPFPPSRRAPSSAESIGSSGSSGAAAWAASG